MNNFSLSRAFLILLLLIVGIGCYLVFKPFLGEFLIAVILVTTFYTFYDRLLKILKGRRKIASLVLVSAIILLIIVPLANFVVYTGQRVVEAYSDSAEYFNEENLHNVIEGVAGNSLVKKVLFFAHHEDGLTGYLYAKAEVVKNWFLSGSFNEYIIKGTTGILTSTANTVVSILIVIFCMFFFFVDGERMMQKLMHLTPLPNKYDKAIFKKFKDVSFSVVLSTFITALAQGLIGAVGFLIIGFPVFFPSFAMAFASIIPYVGTALIWAPISVYLLFTGQIWQGIFLIIWGAVVVGNSDNLLRTFLIKDKAEVHPLFVFFSILGGLSLFGFWGLIYGPLIISLAVTILHIYEMEYENILEK